MNALGTYTDSTNATNNLTLVPLNPLNFREDLVRIDYTINSNNNIYGRWVNDSNSLIDPFGTFSNTGVLPTTPTTRNRPGVSFLVSETWSIRPTMINQATANFSYVSQHIPPYGVNWERSTYGFEYNKLFPGAGEYPAGIPYVTILNYAPFQGPNFALNSPTTDIQVGDTVSITKGNHLIKFGAVYIRNRVDQNGRPYYTGDINFTTVGSTQTTGNALADALLGNFQSYTEANADPVGHFRFNQPEAFVQDTWRATQKLSLQYGLRWQLLAPLYAQGNNMSNFDPSVYNSADAITVLTNGKVVPGSGNAYEGLVRASSTGVPSDQTARVPNVNTAALPFIPLGAPRGFYKMSGAFGPRIGLAYAPDAKTAIRGGFGTFYYRAEGNVTSSRGCRMLSSTMQIYLISPAVRRTILLCRGASARLILTRKILMLRVTALVCSVNFLTVCCWRLLTSAMWGTTCFGNRTSISPRTVCRRLWLIPATAQTTSIRSMASAPSRRTAPIPTRTTMRCSFTSPSARGKWHLPAGTPLAKALVIPRAME
jgi:hypothetical protein